MNQNYTLIFFISLPVLFISYPRIAIANSYQLCQPIVEESLVNQDNLKYKTKAEKNTIDINQKQFNFNPSQASIWWAAKQFDPFGGNLIENWLASPQQQQINLTVNWQLWTLLDYFARYRFVNQFGTVARKYGYSLNIVNQNQQCLATYTYNSVHHPPKWELYLKKLGRDSLQAEPHPVPSTVEN